MRNCVRCGVNLDEDRKLWCSKCIERVNEELNGDISRPFEYYFRYHLKRIKYDNNEMLKVWERNTKKKQ